LKKKRPNYVIFFFRVIVILIYAFIHAILVTRIIMYINFEYIILVFKKIIGKYPPLGVFPLTLILTPS